MNFIWIIAAIFLTPGYVCSILMLAGRGSNVVIGLSGLPENERDRWDAKALCRFVGLLLLVFVLFLTGAFVASLYKSMIIAWLVIVLGCIELTAGAIYINKSSRFQKK